MKFNDSKIYDLGTGIYTIPEVASILNLPQSKVRRWMNEYWNEAFVDNYTFKFSDGTGRELVTNFYTLIEFFTFYQLRSNGVSAQKVVTAHDVLSDFLKTKYPFATSNILTDGKTVLFNGEVGEIIKVDRSLQVVIKEVFEPFCKKIDFGQNHLAERFFPLGKTHEIIIDPHRQFGQPVVGDTNILCETVFQLYKGGESKNVIANLYGLTQKQVNDAISYLRIAA